jgi:hypothetical protein
LDIRPGEEPPAYVSGLAERYSTYREGDTNYEEASINLDDSEEEDLSLEKKLEFSIKESHRVLE